MTDLTMLITKIYRETLSDDTLEADSDFFEAGGDSLAAFQVTARLQEEIGADLPVALVFSYPSPEDLAGVVDADLAERVV
ncbi:phosphopantetheine-binding protein [Actinoplanes sp. NPDC049668]|uniref:phosphopantetheine-binding protein n=1 Tax=unclassified Actinoplanes TaxID=2626549 RepID=UPI0033A28F19